MALPLLDKAGNKHQEKKNKQDRVYTRIYKQRWKLLYAEWLTGWIDWLPDWLLASQSAQMHVFCALPSDNTENITRIWKFRNDQEVICGSENVVATTPETLYWQGIQAFVSRWHTGVKPEKKTDIMGGGTASYILTL
jgi:hypothetical protein